MAIYYMDRNGATAGFGDLNNSVWNTTNAYFSASATGTSASLFAWNNTTNAADIASFGNTGQTASGGEISLGSGTINLGGIQALSASPYMAYNTGTLAFGSNAATIYNTTDIYINATCTVTGTNGLTKTGTAPLYLRGDVSNFTGLSGAIANNTSSSVISLQPFTNGSTYFAASTTIALVAGSDFKVEPIFTDRKNVTINGNFSGAGRVWLANTSTINGGTVTFNGTLAGLTGYSASTPQGLYLYGNCTAIGKDLPEQLTYVGAFTIYPGGPICTVNCVDSVAPTYNTSISIFNDSAVDSDFYLRSSGSRSFTISGGLRRDNAAKLTNTIAFVLGGSNTGDNTIAGDAYKLPGVTGSWNVQKSDAGTWVLSGNNAALNATYINAGTLKARNSAALGQSFGHSFANNSILALGANPSTGNINVATPLNLRGIVRNLNGSNTISGLITLAGSTTISAISGELTVASGSTWTGTNALVLTVGESGDSGSVTISDTLGVNTIGSLVKNGAGELTLSNVGNAFTGAVTLNGGTTQAPTLAPSGSNSSIGAGSLLTFTNAAILRYTGSAAVTFNRSLTFSSATGAGVENNGAGTLTLTGAVSATSSTIALAGSNTGFNRFETAILSGANGFAKSGSGRWVVAGANNITGSSPITGGTLVAANATFTSKLVGSPVVGAGAKLQIAKESDGKARCTYGSLSMGGVVGTPARMRIGGIATSPTVLMSTTLYLPTAGPNMTWDLTGDTFKIPGTYTLVEFSGVGDAVGGSGGNVLAFVTPTVPTGRTYSNFQYNSGASPKTITIQIS